MASPLLVEYDAIGDILYLGKTRPYAAQHSEEVDYGVVARHNPISKEVESVEIMFFKSRTGSGQGLNIPILADFNLVAAT